MCRHRGKVVGVVVHIVAVTGLGRSPVAAPVMSDDPIAVQEKEHHLRVPVIGRQGPAVAEDDGLAASPVLVEDFRAVCSGDRPHGLPPLDGCGPTLTITGCQCLPPPLAVGCPRCPAIGKRNRLPPSRARQDPPTPRTLILHRPAMTNRRCSGPVTGWTGGLRRRSPPGCPAPIRAADRSCRPGRSPGVPRRPGWPHKAGNQPNDQGSWPLRR
jgi:hypothetical protein